MVFKFSFPTLWTNDKSDDNKYYIKKHTRQVGLSVLLTYCGSFLFTTISKRHAVKIGAL